MPAEIAELIVVSLQNFLNIYTLILIVRILLTWLQMFDWSQQIMAALSPITDPYLNIFRSFIPPMGGFDLSPMLAILLLQFLGPVVLGLIASVLRTFVSFA